MQKSRARQEQTYLPISLSSSLLGDSGPRLGENRLGGPSGLLGLPGPGLPTLDLTGLLPRPGLLTLGGVLPLAGLLSLVTGPSGLLTRLAGPELSLIGLRPLLSGGPPLRQLLISLGGVLFPLTQRSPIGERDLSRSRSLSLLSPPLNPPLPTKGLRPPLLSTLLPRSLSVLSPSSRPGLNLLLTGLRSRSKREFGFGESRPNGGERPRAGPGR
jgi:hypothetical protein